jgi:hypothetical protein
MRCLLEALSVREADLRAGNTLQEGPRTPCANQSASWVALKQTLDSLRVKDERVHEFRTFVEQFEQLPHGLVYLLRLLRVLLCLPLHDFRPLFLFVRTGNCSLVFAILSPPADCVQL